MLRVSSQNEGFNANLNAVTDLVEDPGVEHSEILRNLTEATINMKWNDLATYRTDAVEILGTQSTVDALAVACGFNGITRVADATGIPIDHYEDEIGRDVRSNIGLDSFDYSSKSARYG